MRGHSASVSLLIRTVLPILVTSGSVSRAFAATERSPYSFNAARNKPVCLVLSAGAQHGLAHLAWRTSVR
jgi:hypothetical protein